ncbi:MAG: hypothetical protein KME21_22700 [Desmonostoc vinosum HA7617-LM4]|nr:hypothetical protein [Desmonostoc vinosum HA7617-LM4]
MGIGDWGLGTGDWGDEGDAGTRRIINPLFPIPRGLSGVVPYGILLRAASPTGEAHSQMDSIENFSSTLSDSWLVCHHNK